MIRRVGTPNSSVYAPRSIVLVGGHRVPFISWRVENTGFDNADMFEVFLPFEVKKQSSETILTSNSKVSSLLLTEKDIVVEIYRGVPKNPNSYKTSDLRRNIIGYVDTVAVQFDQSNGGEVIVLTGRDMSALFIDNEITSKHQNSTSSQIALYYAKKHGLSHSIYSTRTLAGNYYNKNSSVISSSSSEWDLLMFLAQQEGYVVRIYGTILYFGPIEKVTDIDKTPINATWGKDIENLDIERSPHGARDLDIYVISYHRHSKKRIVGHAKGLSQHTAKLSNPVNRDTYKEYYRIPNLTQAQANAKAKSILARLSKTQLVGTLKTYGEKDFTVDRRISLKGCGAVLSTTYYVQRVTETFDIHNEGFSAEVAFINQLLLPGGTNS